MPYTGNLLRISQPADARALPPPSPRHGTNESDPSAGSGERSVPVGTGLEYAGTDFPPVIMSGFGMQLNTPSSWAGDPPGGPDETPYRITYPRGNAHDSTAVLSAVGAVSQSVGGPGRTRAHDGAQDRGYTRVAFSPAPLFGDSQLRQEIDTEGYASPYTVGDEQHTKFVRGRNSLPENNPDRVGYTTGFRPGRERVRAWDNTVRTHIDRLLGVQMLQPRDAYTPNPARRMFLTVETGPALPRDAGNPDDVAMAATSYATSAGSVIGGF